MKTMVVLYIPCSIGKYGFLMEKSRMFGQETTVPPATEVPHDEDPDIVAGKYVFENLALLPEQIIMEPMGKREMEVTDPRTGRTENCIAFRYIVKILPGDGPKTEWTDPTGYVHQCTWSCNRPY